MKLFLLILPLLSLKSLPSLCQSLTEEIYQLIVKNQDGINAAQTKITAQTDQTMSDINELLYNKLIPSVNQIYEDIENYIQDLQNQTSEYDTAHCISSIRENLASGKLLNVTEKAIHEMENVYLPLVANILISSLYTTNVISREVDSLAAEFSLCMRSEAPEYCNKTLTNKIVEKQAELPKLYEKEVELYALTLTEIVVRYENRIHNYVQEALVMMEPYIELLESCVSIVLSIGNY